MFLSRRTLQAEYLDEPNGSPASVAHMYEELGRINRLFQFADPFQRLLPRWLGVDRCRRLSFLDVGAGDGSLGQHLALSAAKRGWVWTVTNLDLNPLALQLNPGGRNVAGSVLNLPFPDGSFDVVIASQMTHHLATEQQVERHFAEAWRVTREILYFHDLHRNAVLLALVWLSTRAFRLSPAIRADGTTSVRRGWRVAEWKRLAAQAGISNARVWLYFGTRIILQAQKNPRSAARAVNAGMTSV